MRSEEERSGHAKWSEHHALKRNTSTGHGTIKAEWKAIEGEAGENKMVKEEDAGKGRLSGLISYYP